MRLGSVLSTPRATQSRDESNGSGTQGSAWRNENPRGCIWSQYENSGHTILFSRGIFPANPRSSSSGTIARSSRDVVVRFLLGRQEGLPSLLERECQPMRSSRGCRSPDGRFGEQAFSLQSLLWAILSARSEARAARAFIRRSRIQRRKEFSGAVMNAPGRIPIEYAFSENRRILLARMDKAFGDYSQEAEKLSVLLAATTDPPSWTSVSRHAEAADSRSRGLRTILRA